MKWGFEVRVRREGAMEQTGSRRGSSSQDKEGIRAKISSSATSIA